MKIPSAGAVPKQAGSKTLDSHYDVCRIMMFVAYDIFECVAFRVCRSALKLNGCVQRIFIYKEYKAKSPCLHSADIYPRKQSRSSQSPKTWSLLCTVTPSLCYPQSYTSMFCTFCSPSTSLFRAHILSSQKLEGFKNMHV